MINSTPLFTQIKQALNARFTSAKTYEALPVHIGGLSRGAEGLLFAQIWQHIAGLDTAPRLLLIARDGTQMQDWAEGLAFFAPELEVIEFPAWDCLPYDRASPSAAIIAKRLNALTLLGQIDENKSVVVLTTINAISQKLPPKETIKNACFEAKPGQIIDMEDIVNYLEEQGYQRNPTVRDIGEYAVRGGIIDIFPPSFETPVRLDFFGDSLEAIRTFDAESQRTIGSLKHISFTPNSEVMLNESSIKHFRKRYISTFGAPKPDEPLYAAISAGHRYHGFEHWLPFFYETLDNLTSYFQPNIIIEDNQDKMVWEERFKQVNDYYQARKEQHEAEGVDAQYKPIAPTELYIAPQHFEDMKRLTTAQIKISSLDIPEGEQATIIPLKMKAGRNFGKERAMQNENVFDHVAHHIQELQNDSKHVFIACHNEIAAERLAQVFEDRKLPKPIIKPSFSLSQIGNNHQKITLITSLLETGFEFENFAILSEQDILGDRIIRKKKRRKSKANDVLTEVSSLSVGDYVVHADHGIGRFERFTTVTAIGAPHDCLELIYAGGDKLYLPVENLELLSRYGSENTSDSVLDKLGGGAWQARKARVKKRLLDMADKLVKIAAERLLKKAPVLAAEQHDYDEFASRFAYDETEDQARAIQSVIDDLTLGRPMDRLVCGDVGFGKTEVAIRAAFSAAMSGVQVAVVVPTTLLARQHYANFVERFKGLPINIAQLSRLVPSKEQKLNREALKTGHVDIVIGTHALLSKNIHFDNLGLLIIDEEQRFGVKHKERLKDIRAEVHVLTLTATPIPRTLQMSMAGIREMSLITTPPVDRLAVRSFVGPFDILTIREALLREKYRGGQSYFVVPRIQDIPRIQEFLENNVPEVNFAVAHGQLSPEELDDIMTAFYEGKYDILLSTTIIESGIDVANANTMIVHNAHRFGLAQLYQLKGRVGRSKTRAFAYFTTPQNMILSTTAEKRLKVLQSLEGLGAGFTLASHDLDIRGGGNLLGEEQSGQIKEVGFELYQHMLEEAIASLKSGEELIEIDGQWSPTIQLGTAMVIPESYIEDLDIKLSLYRRLASAQSDEEIDDIMDEMNDRFGVIPDEVKQLVDTIRIKMLCRIAGIEKIDAGPKGAVVSFRKNIFANPEALITYLNQNPTAFKIRPDQRLQIIRNWKTEKDRITDILRFARKLKEMIDK